MGKNMLIEALRNNAKDKKMFYSDAEFITYKTGFPTIDYYMGSMMNVFDAKGNLAEVYPALGITGGCYVTFAAKPACGKAQPLDTIIPTPTGDKLLGDLKVGDYVYDRKGMPTKVLGTYDQGYQDAFMVVFDDGRTTICNDQHLWTYYTARGNFKTVELAHMIKKGLKNDSGVHRFEIPMNEPIYKDEKEFSIDPYVIGAFIGNGCCLERMLSISSNDDDTTNLVAEKLGVAGWKHNSEHNYTCTFYNLDDNGNPKTINTKSVLGEFENDLMVHSYDKRIPKIYMDGSIDQRYELARGLFDTDGHVAEDGSVNYTTTSPYLAADIKKLLLSLGIKCRIREDKRGFDKYTNGHCYTVSVVSDFVEKSKLFHLKRKKDRLLNKIPDGYRYHHDRTIIKKVIDLGYKLPMRCIYVDNDEHLYLTNDCIVTHNTTLAIQMASNIVRPFDNGTVIHYDIERSSTQTRCATLSRFSIDEIREGKYILRQLDCSLENLKEAISEIYMEKITNPDKYRYNSGKKNELGEDICPYVPTCMIVDSIASVTSEVNPNTKEGRVKIGEISTQTEVMRLNGEISRFLKESLEMVKEANIIVFFINHIKQKPSVGFPVQADLRYLKQDENLPCGRALQYYSSLMVRLTSVGSEKYLKEEDGFDGYGIQWQFMKNRTNIDGKIVPLVFAPVTGYDSLRSSFMYAKGLGMIGGNKNGFYLTSNKDKKFKFSTIHEDFKEDKELYKELYGAIIPELEKELSSVKPEELEVVDEEMDY